MDWVTRNLRKPPTHFDLSCVVDNYNSGASESELTGCRCNYKSTNKEAKISPLFPNVDGIYFLTHDGGCGGATSDAVTLM